MFKYIFAFTVFCAGSAVNCFSQWTGSCFEQKVFVQNNGQFSSEVLYKTTCQGVNVYFLRNGLTYRYDEPVSKEEREKKTDEKREREKKPKVKKHSVGLSWVGSAQSVEVFGEDKVQYVYNYSYDPARDQVGVKANAFKKIIYRNIYPEIDLQYEIPEKGGLKYSFIVHPGGDIGSIKLKWNGTGISNDGSGNIVVGSTFGNFVDHAPETFYEDGTPVSSYFKFNGNEISFFIPSYNKNRTIIIDPWTVNPNFTSYNAAYDVDYDFSGNVYAYGGDGWNNPFELIKFNSAGAIQWVFVTSVFTSSAWYSYYGDFAVDGYSQSIYIAEGMNTTPGSRVLKLNAAGSQIAMHPGSALKEIWRIAYNSCTKQGVLGGSGWDQPFEAALFDTTLTTINAIHILGPQGLQDVGLLAMDNAGNCFMGFSTNGTSANNQLMRCPAATLLPYNYLVGNHYELAEVQSQSYVSNSTGTNGLNGLAVNSSDLFSYNGYKVKRHNKNSGAVLDSARLTPPQYAIFSSTLLINWGGIAVDECNNIFVGSHDTIYQLDINLNKVGFMLAPGTVYDLKLSPTSNEIYVACKNFVAVLTTSVSCNNMTITAATAGSCAASSATVTPTGGTAPYTYLWNPGGHTTQVVTGLATGTYSVTVWDNSCPPIIQTITVSITSGALTASVTSTPSSCLAANGSATVTPTGGSAPFTYSWSPSGGNSSVASGLGAGTFSVTVTDASGCSGISLVTITTAGGPTVSVTGQVNVSCFGGSNGTATVNAAGGTQPYTYIWNSGQTTSSVSNLPAGNYSVVVTDAAGCSQIQSLSVTAPAAITATATATPANCTSSDGTAAVSVAGGISPYTYSWNNGQTIASISNLSSGNYSVVITDANGCTQTANTLVTSTGGPVASVSANVTIASGNSTTLTASGGGTYMWNNGSSDSAVQVAPTVTTIYCVTVTDANNCIDTACVTVFIVTEPTNSCSSFSAEGAFVLPSAFSPNGDGQNDRWRLLYPPLLADCIAEFHIAVYSRWGELVFEGFSIAFSWDGIYNEKEEGTAVFAYYLNATMKDGTKITKKGNVSLIR